MTSPLTFQRSARYTGDFLVTAPGGGDARADRALTALGAKSIDIGPHASLYSFGLDASGVACGEAALFGVARVGGVMRLGPALVAPPVGDIAGQCMLIERHADSVRVRGDFLGLFPTFYAHGPHGLVVSNRIHLIAAVLAAVGAKPAFLSDIGATRLLGGAFGLQLITHETPLAGIFMLDIGAMAAFSGDGGRIANAPAPKREPLEPEEYWALIERGAEDVRANVAAALDSPDADRVVVMQTAGKDSRVILAALAGLGRVGEVVFRTMRLDEIDVRLTPSLVAHFGGRYDDAQPRYVKRAPEEAFDQRRSVYMGLYSQLSDMGEYLADFYTADLHLIGGCGEVYRSFSYGFQPRWTDQAATQENVEAMLASRSFIDGMTARTRDRVAARLTDEFSLFPGETLRQKLPHHYKARRNRLHFGMAGWVRRGARVQPLASPALEEAAERLPFAIRRKGRILFDVTRALCPEAAALPFSGDLFDMKDDAYHRPHALDGVSLPMPPRPDILEAAEARVTPAPSAKALSLHFLQEATFQAISDLKSSPLADDVGEAFAASIAHADLSRFEKVAWAARVTGVRDLWAL